MYLDFMVTHTEYKYKIMQKIVGLELCALAGISCWVECMILLLCCRPPLFFTDKTLVMLVRCLLSGSTVK